MPISLRTRTVRTIEHLWEDRMGAQRGTLRAGEVSYVQWPGFSAAVIVEIGEALLVAGPSEAIDLLRVLPWEQLANVEAVESALQALCPELVGKAMLGYADTSTFTRADTSGSARPADRRTMEAVISQCGVDDRDESGLLEMSAWFVADDEGMPVAAAGYEGWSEEVAQCGVVVTPQHRGRGLGQSVASAAVGHALGAHDVVQWRSRDTNTASTQLGERLGFAQIGTQTAFDVHL